MIWDTVQKTGLPFLFLAGFPNRISVFILVSPVKPKKWRAPGFEGLTLSFPCGKDQIRFLRVLENQKRLAAQEIGGEAVSNETHAVGVPSGRKAGGVLRKSSCSGSFFLDVFLQAEPVQMLGNASWLPEITSRGLSFSVPNALRTFLVQATRLMA